MKHSLTIFQSLSHPNYFLPELEVSVTRQQSREWNEWSCEYEDGDDGAGDGLMHDGRQNKAERQQGEDVGEDQEKHQEWIWTGKEASKGQEKGEEDTNDDHGDGRDKDPDKPHSRVAHAHNLHDLKKFKIKRFFL